MATFVYHCSRQFLRGAFWLMGGLELHGMEKVPPDGPLIVACSHQSHLDPMILGAAFDRDLHFLARRSLFKNPLFAWLIRNNQAFPLDREGDIREALRAFGEFLDKGCAVVMFPEGTRSPDGILQDMKPGVGMLAVRNLAPVLPVYIWGSYQSWPRGTGHPRRHHLKAIIEKPIIPSPDRSRRKEEQERITLEIGRVLRSLERRAWVGEQNPPAALPALWRQGRGETE